MEESSTMANEPKIPVFTVIKNGAILKNIFVVNGSTDDDRQNRVGETLVVGRHPDCSIALTHPSISRFHLRIHTLPSSERLAVTDLSSVHGTWVSGVKIEAGTRVELKEGDTIQLGGSSRIYRLQWVPLSRAYDYETPHKWGLDVIAEEKEDENGLSIHQGNENIVPESEGVQIDSPIAEDNGDELDEVSALDEKENTVSESEQVEIVSVTTEDNGNEFAEANSSVSAEDEDVKSINSVSDGMATLFTNENSGVYVKKEIPSAPQMPEGVTYLFHEEGRAGSSRCGNTGTKLIASTVEGFILENENQLFEKDLQSFQPPRVYEGENLIYEPISSPINEENGRQFGNNWEVDNPKCGSFHTKSMNLSSGADSVILENGSQLFMRDEQGPGLHEDGKKESLHCTKSINFSSPVEAVSSETGSHQSVSCKQSLRPNSIRKALFGGEGSPDVNLNLVLNLDAFRFAEVVESYAETEPSNEREKQKKSEGENTECNATERKSDLLMNLDSVLTDEVFPSAEKAGVKDRDSTWSIDSIHCDYRKVSPAPPKDGIARSSISVGEAFVKAQDEQFLDEHMTPQSQYSGGLTERPVLDSHPSRSQKKKTPQSHYSSGLTERQAIEAPSVRSQKKSSFSTTRSRSVEPAGVLQMKEEKSRGRSLQVGTATKNTIKMKENNKVERISKVFSSRSNLEEEEALTPGKENRDPQYSCSSGLTQRLALESPIVESDKIPSMSSIWSRRGKPVGILHVKTENDQEKSLQTGTDAKDEVKSQENVEDKTILKGFSSDIDGYKGDVFTPDQENLTPHTLMFRSMKKMGELGNIEKSKPLKATSKGHFDTDGEEGSFFTPDKENLTPTNLMLRSMKKTSELLNIENSKPLKATTSEVNVGLDFHPSRDLFASPDRENQIPEKILQEQESAKTNTNDKPELENKNFVLNRRAERIPFQSLSANSASFIPSASTQSLTSVSLSRDIQKKNDLAEMCKQTRWIMFVDTASLLDKDSRKALELLQGIKGTHLYVPRIVIRELNSLRQRVSLFRSTSEASQVLQWIEDSMLTTNWWIQVQSSVDEDRLIAPTPPASPQSLICHDIPPVGSLLSAGHKFMGIMSPTPEDHVLDCALHYRKMNNDAQIILISNDVNVKIKAMAEGLLCETAQEFRESLVNPFSGRFLWTDSSPRGLTWDCLDDVVLKEKYYPSPKTKLLKREAKGLKLILLHNAHYGRI